MIAESVIIGVFGVVGAIFTAFGGWTFPVVAWNGISDLIGYYNTFLSLVPPLRVPFMLFIYGLGLEIMLLFAKFFLGNKVPTKVSD